VKILSLLLSIYFFAGSLMPGSDWDELPKVVDLIEHYQHHEKESEGKLSFSDFLFLHYSNTSNHFDDDCRLPFQHTFTSAYTAEIQHPELLIIQLAEYPIQPVLHITKETRDHVSYVFQPPQLG
jgi:hypothetical protein